MRANLSVAANKPNRICHIRACHPPSIQEGLNDPLDIAMMFQCWGHMEGNQVELIYQKQNILCGNQVGLFSGISNAIV